MNTSQPRGNQEPIGWESVDLRDVGDLFCGQSPASSEVNLARNGIPYVSGPEQWDGHAVELSKWTTNPKRVAPPRSIFITVKGAGVGTTFPGLEAAIGRDIYAYAPSEHLDVRFVLHAIRYTVSTLTRNAVGDIPGLSKSHIEDHPVGIPPSPEQRRIVEAIESYFTRLDDAVATLERVQRNLKRYRASVLKAADEGRLVPTEAEVARAEGRDYEPASVLLERILTERRRRWEENELAKMQAKGKTPKDDRWKAKYEEPEAASTERPRLPDGWCWTTVGECSASQVGHAFKSADFLDEGVNLLRGDNIGHGQLRWDAPRRKCIQAAALADFGHLALETDDIVLAMDRPVISTGLKIATVKKGDLPALLVQRVLRLRPGIDRRYILVNLLSDSFVDYLNVEAKGGGVPHVSEEQVANFAFPLPPLAEQRRISSEVDRLLSTAVASTETTELTLLRTARLRQSILKWAFEGRLVDQDPTDEPASALLERIRAERAASGAGGSSRSRRRVAKS